MKLTNKDKMNMYYERQVGKTWTLLSKKYGIRKCNIQYYVSLMELHGIEVIKKKRNASYSRAFKLECINRVLVQGETSYHVSLEVGLPNAGTLANWIHHYKENGYNMMERKRGRPPMKKNLKQLVKTGEDEVTQLKKKIVYLEAENEFLKKWNAVVQLEEKRKKKK